jgi:hypothetical protein
MPTPLEGFLLTIGWAAPFVISLCVAGHQYLIRVLLPSKCGGANDPNNIDCEVFETIALGDPHGPIADPVTVFYS